MGLIPRFLLDYLPVTLIVLFSSSLLFSVNGDSPTPSASPTVYEILSKYGLPSGLLPDSVTSYTLEEDGSFVVNLEKACYIQFDYLVYYEKKITGKISIGKITNLKGIQVQRFFLWFDVDEIKVDLPPSDSIYFVVGFINKQLDVRQFETIRSCGKGLSGGSWRSVFQLPTPADDVQLLLTE